MKKRQYSSEILIRGEGQDTLLHVLRLIRELKVPMEVEKTEKDEVRSELILVSSSTCMCAFIPRASANNKEND